MLFKDILTLRLNVTWEQSYLLSDDIELINENILTPSELSKEVTERNKDDGLSCQSQEHRCSPGLADCRQQAGASAVVLSKLSSESSRPDCCQS